MQKLDSPESDTQDFVCESVHLFLCLQRTDDNKEMNETTLHKRGQVEKNYVKILLQIVPTVFSI